MLLDADHVAFASSLLRTAAPLARHRPLVKARSGRCAMASSQDWRAAAPKNQYAFEIDMRQWASSDGVDNNQTHVSEPVEITCYSRDAGRVVHFGSRSQLLPYRDPTCGVNLGDGYDTYREKQSTGSGVEPVVQALQEHGFDLDSKADIVTYRNNLNKIALLPYNDRDPWEMDCTQVGRTVFLEVRKLDEGPIEPRHQRFMYYGYRFEALCTGVENEPVDANSEFCSLIRLRVANHRILLAAEIDCATAAPDSEKHPLQSYVELKTMREVRSDRDYENMVKHRYLKYWVQSYLAGVRTIVIGARDDDGRLLNVNRVLTGSLPREARAQVERAQQLQGGGPPHFSAARKGWDPFVCINALSYILAKLRRICDSSPETTFRVQYEPRTHMLRAWPIAGPGEALASRIRDVRRLGRDVGSGA